jgi:adenylate kinase family enzyme
MPGFPYQRVCVIGTTGSGKSTLAEELARRYGLKYIELDALNWQPNWQPAERGELRLRLAEELKVDAWVVAGNYNFLRDLVWPKAEVVIWLDYGLPLIFWRLLVRTLRRSLSREVLWNGNIENLWTHLKLWSDDSLFKWLFKSYWRRKRETPGLLSRPEHAHLKLIQLRSAKQTREWLAGL